MGTVDAPNRDPRAPWCSTPRHARGFFEALVADNLDIGRPELIELIFKRGQRRGAKAGGQYKTKIVTYGTEVNVNAFYRHSRIKQYLKDGRALRIETVINDPEDLGCRRRLQHLDELQTRHVRSTPPCWILNVSVRAASLRVQPLSGSRAHLYRGWQEGPGLAVRRPSGPGPGWRVVHQRARRHRHHHKSLRALMTGLLGGSAYSMNQASYDLARLRVNGSSPASHARTAIGSLATGCGLRSSTPSSTTGCCARCSPPTDHHHHCRSEKP